MKFSHLLIGTLLLLAAQLPTSLHAQPFFGYQSIGVHSWYFSLNWDQQGPSLGVGYGFRQGWSGFTELTAEWRSPLDALFTNKRQTWIVGAYGPARLQRRPFLGMGLHLRAQQLETGMRYTIAGTLLPSYTFAASTNDRPYLTGGLRATGLLTLAETSQGSPNWLPAAGVELGGNVSLLLERTLGAGINYGYARHWALGENSLSEAEQSWQPQGTLHLGSTYYLRRW